jgi:magnesium chelatase family protein
MADFIAYIDEAGDEGFGKLAAQGPGGGQSRWLVIGACIMRLSNDAKAPRCQQAYQGRVSGPLLDRIDLAVDVPPVTAADLTLPAPSEGTAEVAARVAAARDLARARADSAGEGASALNALAEGEWLETISVLDAPARSLMTRAAETSALSARGWTRTLRLARTIADLEGATAVRRVHVAEALIYRRINLGGEAVTRKAGTRGRIGAWT